MKKNDSGHAKNVTNFEKLYEVCTGLGDLYKPSNDLITLGGMATVYKISDTVIDEVQALITKEETATNNRYDFFSTQRKFATRVMGAITVAGASEKTLEDARGVLNKINGKRANPKKDDISATKEEDAPKDENATQKENGSSAEHKYISVSQQSYDFQVEHFTRLIEIPKSLEKYTPNEVDLSIPGLNTRLAQLKANNSAVIKAERDIYNKRAERDKILYAPVIGLIYVAILAKAYIKSVFGVLSPEYKQVSGLEFKEIKPRK